MGTIIRGNKTDRVIGGALLGGAILGLEALLRGRDPLVGFGLGALAGGTAQAHHRLAARGAASVQYALMAKTAAQVIDAMTRPPQQGGTGSVQPRPLLPR